MQAAGFLKQGTDGMGLGNAHRVRLSPTAQVQVVLEATEAGHGCLVGKLYFGR